MPAPNALSRSQQIEKSHLDGLAIYANEKSRLAGVPYSFSSLGGWKNELARLRQNLFLQDLSNSFYSTFPNNNVGPLTNEYLPLTPEWLISPHAKRCLASNVSSFISWNGNNNFASTAQMLTKSKFSPTSGFYYFYYPEVILLGQLVSVRSLTGTSTTNVFGRSSKNVDYFCSPTGNGAREVTTRLHLNKQLWVDGSDENDEDTGADGLFRLDLQQELMWSLAVNVPQSAICSGSCRTPSFTLAPGVVPSISAIGELASLVNITVPAGANYGIISWSFYWGDRDLFNLGIRINNYDPNATSPSRCHFSRFTNDDRLVGFDVSNQDWAYIEWEFKTKATPYPAICSGETLRAAIPNCSVTHSSLSAGYSAGRRGLKIAVGSNVNGIRYSHGNLGRVLHTPSPDISGGVFVGNTTPIRESDVGASILNTNARRTAPFVGTSEVKQITPGIDYVIPSYPIRHEPVNAGAFGQKDIPVGSIIFKVSVWRTPVLNGDVYEYPANPEYEAINFGYIRDGQFVSIMDFELGYRNEDEFYPDWVVLTSDIQLVYQTTSGLLLGVTANVVLNSINTTFVPSFFTDERFLKFPILSEHYNDALTGLNLIS